MKTHQMIRIFLVILISISLSSCKQRQVSSDEKVAKTRTPDASKPIEMPVVRSLFFDFEKETAGQLPAGWSQYFTGRGNTSWKVTEDQGNKVLGQLYSDNPNGHFNVVVYDSLNAKDMKLQVRIKGFKGRHDRGGGFVWRFKDKNNYYVVRENPLEDNVVLYKVENGKRTDLPVLGKGRTYGVDVPALGDSWNTLGLTVRGDVFTVFLNGKELFKVKDETFKNSGKVGFWTKADAVSYFDDFRIEIF